MTIQITPIILCGGSGNRLWPLSRSGFPKQFLVLSGNRSLFQQAINRVNTFYATDISINKSIVVANEEHRFLLLEQLRELPNISASLLLEPVGRNTAPALTLAALQARYECNDPVLVVTPSDQIISDLEAFTITLEKSIRIASAGSIVILGVTPHKPETGFGYIKYNPIKGFYDECDVIEFTEKPNRKTAEAYLTSGDYSWNSGIFVVRASVWLSAIKTFRHDIFEATKKSFERLNFDQGFIRPDRVFFEAIPSDSIDYAVIEKCPNSDYSIKMLPIDVGWNDLGAWNSFWQLSDQDVNGNVCHGDTIIEDTTNTLIHSSYRLVSTLGVSNLVIIETADAVLVANRESSQEVKKIVATLVSSNRQEHILHRKVSRPWGWYDTIDCGDRFKVKRIQVNPGASLSLQKHNKRAEHWIVVRGEAEVTCGENVIYLHENESTFIPQGQIHRLANIGKEPLEIIEVQSGLYLGEDDIVRFNDFYGRN